MGAFGSVTGMSLKFFVYLCALVLGALQVLSLASSLS